MSGKGLFVVDDNVGISLLTAVAIKNSNKKYILVTSNLYKAQKIFSTLSQLVGDDVVLFPADELIRAETISSSKELIANRIFALDKIINNKPKIIVTNLSAALRYLPSPELFKKDIIEIKIGDNIDVKSIRRTLINSGYQLVNKIDQSLQFAIRGDIIDIYSVNNEFPIRIELFGNEVESIREFDISTQKSSNKLQICKILPGNDILLSDEDVKSGIEKIQNQLEKDKSVLTGTVSDNLLLNVDEDISKILENNIDVNLYKYFGYMQCKNYSLFDYAEDYIVSLVDINSLKVSEEMLIKESHEFLYELFNNGKSISHLSYYQVLDMAIRKNKILQTTLLAYGNNYYDFGVSDVKFVASNKEDAIRVIRSYLNDGYKIIVALSNSESINLISEYLLTENINFELGHDLSVPQKDILLTSFNLNKGFVCEHEKLVVLTSFELFNEKVRVVRFDSRFKKATILTSFEDLEPGDFVVHEYQGIGRFVSLETMEVNNEMRDYLKIEYGGNEFLYVPLTQFQLVRKYQGKEGAAPKLSRLHSKDWENTKARIKEKINDLAKRLFDLYKERSAIKGYAFQEDDEIQEDFEKSFHHELTPDQKKAVQEIKQDMMSDHPMDRLVCGDVGFGKTEVAFEAIFKAISSGKQAVILCPTTLLARQHFERAVERFSPYDIKVALFSRFVTDKQEKEYIKGLADGSIHLAIGTHKILSNKISFKDLGLLVIDEEQRFGVEQKEKIKELRSNIDVLTLSATPIPRTLQISLLGVRSLSQINTAPNERMPIQTYVMPYSLEVVKELIERELGREGQVFYLHNNVSTLSSVASRLHKAVPSAKIAMAHGQMPKEELEKIMDAFYCGNIDVLVCTSIIENGIDIPNANMIIVDDSDHYGLAQLYQIKGRVGRGNRIAYAYLMFNGQKILNENAQKRLKAIQDFTELGSGYKIAQRDLMIRGAGDILGPDQAGFIDSIGLDLYIKLLNEAVQEKTGKTQQKATKIDNFLNFSGYIPDQYAADSNKIEMYQDILSCSSTESLSKLKLKVRDIYGIIPKEVELLFSRKNIELLFADVGANNVKETQVSVEFNLGDEFINIRGVGNMIFEAIIPYLTVVKIGYLQNKFKVTITKNDGYLKNLEGVLYNLREILIHNKVIEIS